ncbi:MAG: hypothetical protein EOQ31_31675 [Mesorhizobium sp.]|uniref:hypothetical protein n=1 Tax=Mesorhizobium sp. TaxID=1871066 RepID=UPI000FE62026|nr:hypothetical protein [Mesorhizobium sp.]RWA81505.1 MAG: hypothetical protein EOQ31_31675 [Mesorhizobium sp.]
MGEIWVKEFSGGLDARRMVETTPGGILIQGSDGHLTRGGEFEKRAAFVTAYTLPQGTKGLAYTRTGLVVFGSAAAPTLPDGVAYQQLAHPDGTPFLISVPSFDLYAGKIYAVGVFSDGSIHHFYDGVRVDDWFDGRARASFRVTAGGTGSSISALTVDGIAIISGSVNWTTSNAATAAAIAAAINADTTTPEYTAVSVDDQVVIVADDPGTAANGKVVAVTLVSGFGITPADGIAMAGGAEEEDTFEPGEFVKTIGSKVYSTSGPNMHFSGIKIPTGWTTDNVGAGFIDMSSESSGSEQLIALAKYQNSVAVFAETVIQIWYVDPDPTLNKQSQVLNNTGTGSPKSVTQFGDNDLFYLNESGLRSLRARDASNAASTTDIGSPVDPLITAVLSGMTPDARKKIIGLIEPRDGRFWLIMGDRIFVFSFFSGASVSAWSEYIPGFTVDEAVVFGRRVYLRSGDTIYVYGGLDSDLTYDDTEAVAQIPYLDADKPWKPKTLTGVDVAAQGTWKIFTAMNPNNLQAQDAIGTIADVIADTTFNDGRIPAQGKSTHFSLIFKSQGSGYAKIGSCVIHFEADGDDD